MTKEEMQEIKDCITRNRAEMEGFLLFFGAGAFILIICAVVWL